MYHERLVNNSKVSLEWFKMLRMFNAIFSLLVLQLAVIEASLQPHQKKVDDDGYSIFQRSVIEHNMLATSKLYDNISFDGLADLLGISDVNAEKIATKMISTDRLKGSIDQLERIVFFEGRLIFLLPLLST
jgi:hypothetical protein